MGNADIRELQKENIVKNLNCHVSKEDHDTLKEAAAKLGGISLSALIRVGVNNKLARYRETGDPKVFLD